MKQLVISYDFDTKFCELYHPYSKRFVAFVSQGVKPLSHRKFDSNSRRWSVHVSRVPQVVAAGKRYFDHVDYKALPPDVQIRIVQFAERGEARPKSSRLRARPEVAPHAVLFVTENAPPEVIKAAYRALAQIHHPDHGGSEEEFKKIDTAYKVLKQ